MELYLLGKILAYIASFFAIMLLVDFLRTKDETTTQEKSESVSENEQKKQKWSPEQKFKAAIILFISAIILFTVSKFLLKTLTGL